MKGPPLLVPFISASLDEVFRAYRFPPDYAGFEGQDLTPGDCLVEPRKQDRSHFLHWTILSKLATRGC